MLAASEFAQARRRFVSPVEELEFQAESKAHARLVVVEPKKAHQQLTVTQLVLSGTIEDASDRNPTLLVAISTCRIRDTGMSSVTVIFNLREKAVTAMPSLCRRTRDCSVLEVPFGDCGLGIWES